MLKKSSNFVSHLTKKDATAYTPNRVNNIKETVTISHITWEKPEEKNVYKMFKRNVYKGYQKKKKENKKVMLKLLFNPIAQNAQNIFCQNMTNPSEKFTRTYKNKGSECSEK